MGAINGILMGVYAVVIDLVNINAHTKFGQNLLIRSQDMS